MELFVSSFCCLHKWRKVAATAYKNMSPPATDSLPASERPKKWKYRNGKNKTFSFASFRRAGKWKENLFSFISDFMFIHSFSFHMVELWKFRDHELYMYFYAPVYFIVQRYLWPNEMRHIKMKKEKKNRNKSKTLYVAWKMTICYKRDHLDERKLSFRWKTVDRGLTTTTTRKIWKSDEHSNSWTSVSYTNIQTYNIPNANKFFFCFFCFYFYFYSRFHFLSLIVWNPFRSFRNWNEAGKIDISRHVRTFIIEHN